MKRYVLGLPLALALLGTAFAQQNATPVFIPILNANFDADDLGCGAGASCYSNGATGWLCGAGSGVAKFSNVQYPEAPADGLYAASIGSSYVTGSILQTVGANLQANTTYTLTMLVGARADYPFTGYVASILAGDVTVASGHAATPVGGSFVPEEIVYHSGATPPQLGEPLQVFVKSVGTGQVNVRAVAVSMTASETGGKQ